MISLPASSHAVARGSAANFASRLVMSPVTHAWTASVPRAGGRMARMSAKPRKSCRMRAWAFHFSTMPAV